MNPASALISDIYDLRARRRRALFVFALILLLIFETNAQVRVEKKIENPSLTRVQIDAAALYLLDIETAPGSQMSLEGRFDGEYSTNQWVQVQEVAPHVLLVRPSFQPFFSLPNDKLSAHKVVSASMHLVFPEGMDVEILGTDGKVQARGTYKNLVIVTGSGAVDLVQTKGLIEVNTTSGPVRVTHGDLRLTAASVYGKVLGPPFPLGSGTSQAKLHSQTGDITRVWKPE